MENLHASSIVSTHFGNLPEWVVGAIPDPLSADASRATPEPPSLGSLPKGPRGRVAILSLALYGGLLGGALSLAVASHAPVLPARVVSVALETPDFSMPAGQPAAPAAAEQPAETTNAQPENLTVPQTPVEAPPSLEGRVVPALPTVGQGLVGGTPGGTLGGRAGGDIGGQGGGVAEASSIGVVAPRFDAAYLQNPEPAYPALSKRFNEEGRVLLRVLVNPDGLPDQVEIRQSSGHVRLDQAALGTVKRWRFTPARRGSERLAAWVLVPLSFNLDA